MFWSTRKIIISTGHELHHPHYAHFYCYFSHRLGIERVNCFYFSAATYKKSDAYVEQMDIMLARFSCKHKSLRRLVLFNFIDANTFLQLYDACVP